MIPLLFLQQIIHEDCLEGETESEREKQKWQRELKQEWQLWMLIVLVQGFVFCFLFPIFQNSPFSNMPLKFTIGFFVVEKKKCFLQALFVISI